MSRKRQGNRPDRRVAAAGSLPEADIAALVGHLRYVGSALHKLRPGDYGFVPPHNPRPSKSPCDDRREVPRDEAELLFRYGLERGMVSAFAAEGVPKYVWAVDEAGEVYEAKTKPGRDDGYHGYRLGDDEEQMRAYIIREWKQRCPQG